MRDKQTTFNLFEDLTDEVLTINDKYLTEVDMDVELEEFVSENPEVVSIAEEQAFEFDANNSERISFDIDEPSTFQFQAEIAEPVISEKPNDFSVQTEKKAPETIQSLDETFFMLEEALGEDTLNEIEDIDIMTDNQYNDAISFDVEKELIDFKDANFGKVKIIAVGIGGCGCNTIDRMYEEKIGSIKLVAIDTSKQTLENTSADEKFLLGEPVFRGHGSGADIEKVGEIFQSEADAIRRLLEGVDMLFITGGIGRGTGTIGLIEIGKIARQMGILTIGFATLPRRFEVDTAVINKYFPLFQQAVDSNVIVENERVTHIAKHLPINKAIKVADKMLVDGIRGISELITSPGKINLDYADIKTAFSNQGSCVMGIGYGKGANAVVKAIEESIHSEITNFENIKGSRVIIFNITCARNSVTIDEATKGTDLIYSYNTHNNIEHLLFGYSYDESMGDMVKVTFVATGTNTTTINYKDEDSTGISTPQMNSGGLIGKENDKEISDPVDINIFQTPPVETEKKNPDPIFGNDGIFFRKK
ncbi:MAG: cell division protein FtsZ [Mycoplasmatales bacterium]